MSSAAGSAARRVGVAPEALALLAGRRRQAYTRVIDFCMENIAQLTCSYGKLAQCDVPLNLYSVSCFSPKSIDFGGVVVALGFSATVPLGRAFSSCLRKGLRMIGIVRRVCGDVATMLSVKDAVRMSWGRRGAISTQCDGRQVAQRRAVVAVEIEWARRLSGGGKLRSPSGIVGKGGGWRLC